jgi:hypothetical protein
MVAMSENLQGNNLIGEILDLFLNSHELESSKNHWRLI